MLVLWLAPSAEAVELAPQVEIHKMEGLKNPFVDAPRRASSRPDASVEFKLDELRCPFPAEGVLLQSSTVRPPIEFKLDELRCPFPTQQP